MKKTYLGALSVAFFAASVAHASFTLVKDFTTGGTDGISVATSPLADAGGNGGISVIAEPGNAENNVLKLDPGVFANGTGTNNVWFNIPFTPITATGTLYTRFQLSGSLVDVVIGTSSKTSAESYGDYSAIARVEIDGILDYHSESYTEVAGSSVVDSIWYELWLVLHADTNTYDVWIKGGNDWAVATKVVTAAIMRYQSVDPQQVFSARMSTGTDVAPKAFDSVYFDDVWVDTTGENITTPGSGTVPTDNGTGALINVSTRANVGVGADILIGGFVVSDGERRVLIRGVGPGLASTFDVPGTLSDPVLELYLAGGSTPIATNDNWGDGADAADIRASAAAVFAFPLSEGSLDSAMLIKLPAGGYTVQIKGKSDGMGVALVEVYQLP